MGFRALEYGFAVVLLLLSMQVEIGLTRPSESEIDPAAATGRVHVLDTIVGLGIEVYGTFLILRRWRRVVDAMRAAWPILSIALLAILSTAWSSQPTVTLRRSILLLFSTVFSIYLGDRYTLAKQTELLARIMCSMMLAILVLYFVAPQYVVDYVSHPGAWKGLSAYKNVFGQYMAISVILLLSVRFQRFDWLRYAFLLLAFAMLYFARSAASLLCCVLIISVMPLWRLLRVKQRQRPAIYSAVATILFSGMYLFTTHTDRVFYLLGRNSSLSGRTDLWAASWTAIVRHPILGYGFDTFWTTIGGDTFQARAGAGFLAIRSDNGYLDLALGLGAVGIILFVFVVAIAFRHAIAYVQLVPESIGLWPITYLCFFLIHNLSESTLITRGDFPTLVFMMIATSLLVMSRRDQACEQSAVYRSNQYTLLPHELYWSR